MTGGASAAPTKLNPREAIDSSLETPKPEPGEPEVKVDTPKPPTAKHAATAKVAKAHNQSKPTPKTKATKKKHPDPKHTVKKPTPKQHSATVTGQ
jgi:hypothetical protein